MATDDSVNDYMGRAVKRYSSLFTLPSHSRLVLYLFIVCAIGGVGLIGSQRTTYYGLALGLGLGFTLFLATTMSDLFAHLTGLREDPTFNLRRGSALSLYSVTLWLLFISLGTVVSIVFDNVNLLFKFFFTGLCGAVTIRLLVLSAISSASRWKVFLFSLLQPIIDAALVVFSWVILGYNLDASAFVFALASLSTSIVAVFAFASLLNRVGTKIVGVDSLAVFKAFLASWTEDLNAPLEGLFERFGVEQDIRVSAIAFKTGGRVKAVMVVPTFHPGPFKNVGSSALPHTIQTLLEAKLGCVVSVPHGLSGHNQDLTSKRQNQKVTDKILRLMDFSNYQSVASTFKQVQRRGARASCQILGDCALVTLTLAPQTMEDLPPDIDTFIMKEAERLGLSAAVAIDAHNSIEGSFKLNEAVEPLKEAAVASLKSALKHRKNPFEAGAAKVTPTEFSLGDGMGLGGITAVVVNVANQLVTYVTIDGNNMVSGLREKMLSELEQVGINEGEIFTTDTHTVNGVVLTAQGYHPLGEVMNHEKLVTYVKQAVQNAVDNLEPAEVAWRAETVSGVKVMGEKQVEALCRLTDEAAERAKRLALSIFSIVGVVLGALFLLL